MELLTLLFLTLLLILSGSWILARHRNDSRVPLGKFGLPLLGETVSLLRSNFFEFVLDHTERFGDVFSTSLFGIRTIFVTTPEDAKFFLSSDGARSCGPTRLASLRNLLGSDQVQQALGASHTRYRKIFVAAMLPEVLKHHVEWIDKLAIESLESWKDKSTVVGYQETVKFTYNVITSFICEEMKTSFQLKTDVEIAINGIHSLPLNVPFTRYHKALQARRRIDKMLDEIIENRRNSHGKYRDFLQVLVTHSNEDGSRLSNKQIRDNMVVAIMAGHHTTSLALLWMMKLIRDNPETLRSLEEEHTSIAQSKALGSDKTLTWEDTRRMPLTLQALYETLRVANVVRVVNREIIDDVEHKGYLYPKGYNLTVPLVTIHNNEGHFANPSIFDPSRFQMSPRPGTFLPFGTGARICPGNELAKLEIMVFIHRLLTQYRWESVHPEAKLKHWPVLGLEDGYLIDIKLKTAYQT